MKFKSSLFDRFSLHSFHQVQSERLPRPKLPAWHWGHGFESDSFCPQVGHSLIQGSHEHKGSFHKVVGGPSLREVSVASQGAQGPGRTSPAGKVLEGFLEEESSAET